MKDFFAVFGSPILHSKSPYIYNHLFKQNNIDAVYTRISADSAEKAMELFKKLELKGGNITMPLKKQIMPFCNFIEANATQIGAVNTIVQISNNIFGFNTDWEGVLFSFQANNISLVNSNIAIIGAGNAASAAIFAIQKFYPDAKMTIINRSNINADNLASKYGVQKHITANITSELIKPYNAVIITTPNSESILKNVAFDENKLIFIASYKHSFDINSLKEKVKTVIFGESWLLYQALPAMEYFIGNDEFCKKIELVDYDKSLNINNIYLTGFSGAGKTSAGALLAEKLNKNFIDLDFFIEKQENRSIEKIFAESGEVYFRTIESQALAKISSLKNNIVALGGGAILDSSNQELLKNSGTIVYIYADFETSLSRISTSMRPLLHNKPKNELLLTYDARKSVYIANSDLIVSNNNIVLRDFAGNLAEEFMNISS